jgi:YD repeat-containing protein
MVQSGFHERKFYRYDALNRLVGVCKEDGIELKYYYDPVGNLIAVNTTDEFVTSSIAQTRDAQVHPRSGLTQAGSQVEEAPTSHRSVSEGSIQSDGLLQQDKQSYGEAKLSQPVERDVQGMDEPLWFILRDKSQYGPYTWGDLIEFKALNRLLRKDLVWCEDLKDWTQAGKIKGLF